MRYHWLTYRVCQEQFDVYWRPGRDNLDDYHTKHHSTQLLKDMHGFIFVKLLPLPHPPVRARTDERTNPSAQRASQLRSVLARVYAVSRQKKITTTVP
jgi:hypothetical protein